MAEAPLAVASAVILPEVEEASQAPSRKRRKSFETDDDAKRRRVSHDGGQPRQESISTQAGAVDSGSGRLAGGQAAEERKRGRRLFGALLGTLSQSSSSSIAQKRRSDIEKKQQDKLKQQIEEADEQTQEKLEALMKIRRKEQRDFDKQSMRIHHSNLKAHAHFLRTRTEPQIFYKPWKLNADEESTVKTQVKDAEEKIESELAQWEAENPPLIDDDEKEVAEEDNPATLRKQEDDATMTVVGEDTNLEDQNVQNNSAVTDGHGSPNTDKSKKMEPSEAANHHVAEGEEMVEGEEDTVIY